MSIKYALKRFEFYHKYKWFCSKILKYKTGYEDCDIFLGIESYDAFKDYCILDSYIIKYNWFKKKYILRRLLGGRS
jgi:hypothetical protein